MMSEIEIFENVGTREAFVSFLLNCESKNSYNSYVQILLIRWEVLVYGQKYTSGRNCIKLFCVRRLQGKFLGKSIGIYKF